MDLDIRVPMGILFLLLGTILAVYGLLADHAIYVAHSLGYNVNLIWGGIFAGFGVLMLWLAGRSVKKL